MKTRTKTRFDAAKVIGAVRKATFETLGHAGAYLRKVARNSIRRGRGPSAPGTPPHTRAGALKNAILYAVEKDRRCVVIGPTGDRVGPSGSAHEFGGQYMRERYPRRAFMGQALEKTKDRLPRMWAASVK
jgi:hypothetical protein